MTPRGTKLRNIRVADEVWVPAKMKAAAEQTTVSDVVRNALVDYIKDEHHEGYEGTCDDDVD